jgi:hypothetical protein
MVHFNDWCDSADTPVGNHHVRVMTGRPADSATGIQVTATAVPAHYAAEERIAGAPARLGKAAAAKMIKRRRFDRATSARYTRRSGSKRKVAIARPSSGCAGRITATWRCAVTMSLA